MSRAAVKCLHFPGDARQPFLAASFDGYEMVPGQEAARSDFTLYDTFDGHVAAAGSFLIVTAKGLRLLNGTDDPPQPGGAAPGFVSDLPESPLRDALTGILPPLRRLSRIGQGRLVHQPSALLDDEGKTLARCECRVFTAASGRCVTRIELRALRGYGKAFARLCAHLDEMPGAISAGQAARLLFPETTGYVAKPEIAITPDETIFHVAGDIIRAYIDVARRNEAGVMADTDSEFLHDYRIALRKIRSVLSLFRGVYAPELTDDLKKRFGALMARTGRLRDLDVYLIERKTYLGLLPGTLHPGLRMLFAELAAKRRIEQRALSRHLCSDAYGNEVRDLAVLFGHPSEYLRKGPNAERPALEYARTMIRKRYRKVCTSAALIDDGTPDEQIHELRIHCKKLRYLMEFFAPLFDRRDARKPIKALKKLQDRLGSFNDYSVQQESLEHVLEGLNGMDSDHQPEIAKSVGGLLTMLDQRQREARGHIVAEFAEFDKPGTRKGFEKLFGKGENRA